ncbi:MAG: hypothetical protein PHR26_02710 [Candidatus ainarchaeum sp.]|nr:hypothetical protein [Candidatus ainarchaeum sp.]MDD3975539.1 hypothetical protein [Candidatus ainarchaeum sp.]
MSANINFDVRTVPAILTVGGLIFLGIGLLSKEISAWVGVVILIISVALWIFFR